MICDELKLVFLASPIEYCMLDLLPPFDENLHLLLILRTTLKLVQTLCNLNFKSDFNIYHNTSLVFWIYSNLSSLDRFQFRQVSLYSLIFFKKIFHLPTKSQCPYLCITEQYQDCSNYSYILDINLQSYKQVFFFLVKITS